jgi:hypothetical protein
VCWLVTERLYHRIFFVAYLCWCAAYYTYGQYQQAWLGAVYVLFGPQLLGVKDVIYTDLSPQGSQRACIKLAVSTLTP